MSDHDDLHELMSIRGAIRALAADERDLAAKYDLECADRELAVLMVLQLNHPAVVGHARHAVANFRKPDAPRSEP